MQVYRNYSASSGSSSSTITEDTASIINLSNPSGNYCNQASANNNRSFTITGAVSGGWAKVLFNTTNPPEVVGATLENGSEFKENTDMYLLVYSDNDGVKFFYLKVTPTFPLEIIPKQAEWVNLVGAMDFSVAGVSTITNYTVLEGGIWNYEFDFNRDWSLSFSGSESGLGVPRNVPGLNNFQLLNVSDDSLVINGDFRTLGQTRQFFLIGAQSIASVDATFEMAQKLEIRSENKVLKIYNNDVLLETTAIVLTENVRLKLSMDDYNLYGLKFLYL